MRYKLNLITDRVLPLVMVSQFDTARTVEFELYDGDEKFVPRNATILIGTNQYEGTISNEVVSFTVPSSLTQTAQNLFGEIVIVDEGRIGTLNFQFVVDSTPHEGESEETDSDRALSILMGRSVKSPDSAKAVNILLGGE